MYSAHKVLEALIAKGQIDRSDLATYEAFAEKTPASFEKLASRWLGREVKLAPSEPRTRSASETRTSGLVMKSATEEQTRMRRRRFVASTPEVDSHGDIVEQKWILDRYLKNPVVLWAHDRFGLPIGKAVAVEMVGENLECEIEFATAEANPRAEEVWQLIQGGYVRAVSVSFWPSDIRWEMRDGEEVCVCSNNELYEISVLALGSNPSALAKGATSGAGPRPPRPGGDDLSDIESNLDKAAGDEDELDLFDDLDDDDEIDIRRRSAAGATTLEELVGIHDVSRSGGTLKDISDELDRRAELDDVNEDGVVETLESLLGFDDE